MFEQFVSRHTGYRIIRIFHRCKFLRISLYYLQKFLAVFIFAVYINETTSIKLITAIIMNDVTLQNFCGLKFAIAALPGKQVTLCTTQYFPLYHGMGCLKLC